MYIEKILNNNVVMTVNHLGEEVVYIGCGLAFNKKIGDKIEEKSVEKEFVLKDTLMAGQFQQLCADVPVKEIEVVKKIVDLAERELDVSLSPTVYLTLADHIHYAIIRLNEGIDFTNPLLFETKKFYPKEFQIAKKGLELIEADLNVVFGENEAGFIAFHLVNGQQVNANFELTMNRTEMVRDILAIITRFFGSPLDEETLNYQRLMTHLHYFSQRYLKNEFHEEEDAFLYELIQNKYTKAFQAVLRINEYLEKKYTKSIGQSEKIYLTIHIQRITGEKK